MPVRSVVPALSEAGAGSDAPLSAEFTFPGIGYMSLQLEGGEKSMFVEL